MDGAELLAGLADGSLPPAQFNHAAHLRVGWELLQQQSPAEAEARFCHLVLDYVRRLGAEHKFHRSLSLALMRILAARCQPSADWPTFQRLNPDLFDDARAVLGRYYSHERLAEGRLHFVEPDLQPLPTLRG